jgi:hypothetical protein
MILVLANSSQMLFSISRYANEFREGKDRTEETVQERA